MFLGTSNAILATVVSLTISAEVQKRIQYFRLSHGKISQSSFIIFIKERLLFILFIWYVDSHH